MTARPTSRRALASRAAAVWTEVHAQSHTRERRCYRWGGRTFCVQFAGPALMAAATRAVAHREVCDDPDPDLTICAWDGASTGHGAWIDDAMASSHAIEEPDADAHDVGCFWLGDSVSLIDRASRRAFFWTPTADAMPEWMCRQPWRMHLHWWWRAHGHQLLHAAAVGRGGAGVLLAGKGGSGKSTTALACLRTGMDLLGDDRCLVGSSPNPGIDGFGLYNAVGLDDATIEAFPEVAALVTELPHHAQSEGGKQLFFLDARYTRQLPERLALKALLLPTVTDGPRSEIVPASAGDGLLALAPSSMMQMPASGPADIAQIGRIARQLPCYRLRLGRDLDSAADAITRLLDG